MKKVWDNKCKIRNCGFIRDSDHWPGHGYSGSIGTPYGIVASYDGEGDMQYGSGKAFTNFRFCFNGHFYAKGVPKALTKRGIIMIAGRFARDVVKAES